MPKAAILGCGPAGLFSAYACALAGVEPFIFSKNGKSQLYGAQFLGESLPYLSTPASGIAVTLQGTESEYRTKVYGPDYHGPVSPSKYVGEHVVFDIRYVYEQLWTLFKSGIQQVHLLKSNFGATTDDMAEEFDFVFSSVPLNAVCESPEHEFSSRNIFAIGDAPDLGVRCPVRVPEGSVIYCGNQNSSWYRAANIFGHCTVEWAGKKPPISGIATATKPLKTNCTCYPNVVRIGRYGEWKKGILAIDAFSKTMRSLNRGVQGALF